MTDEQIQELVLTFLDARGGYVAGAPDLFLMIKQACAAERVLLLDLFSKRVGMSAATLLEHLPELASA